MNDVEVKTFFFTLCSVKMSKQEFENKPAHFKEIVIHVILVSVQEPVFTENDTQHFPLSRKTFHILTV